MPLRQLVEIQAEGFRTQLFAERSTQVCDKPLNGRIAVHAASELLR